MSGLTTACIVGVAGYTGQELAKIIAGHPRLRLAAMFGSESRSGEPIEEVAPALRGIVSGAVEAGTVDRVLACDAEVVFLATPHEASVPLAAELVRAGRTVVDLSAAYRLQDAAQYPVYYGFEHAERELLDSAVYGLPELFRSQLAGAKLIAAAGCYPTSVIVPVAPIAEAGLIEPGRRVIVDSTSGVSGAGRKANERTSFCEVSQTPYGVFSHRHQPEIDAYAGTPTLFTPHLGPYYRGICSTIHVDLAGDTSESDVRRVLEQAYVGEPFVRLLEPGVYGHLIVVSCIDNLLKGASGQAVQALNAAMGFDERLGLLPGAQA
jgi:N-acetyl-gamma-glutamyl-phosphate reductase